VIETEMHSRLVLSKGGTTNTLTCPLAEGKGKLWVA